MSSSPHLSRDPAGELELLALIVWRQAVPFVSRSKAALRAHRQPFERDNRRRLPDSRLQIRLGLEPRHLRADQPQHDEAVVRHMTKRLERARPVVVVLEQVAIESRPAEYLRRNPIVAT